MLAEALSSQRDAKVEVRVASRGDLRKLRELAERNAKLALAQDKLRREHRRQQRVESLSALAEALDLERVPVRIEGFDISNLGETHTVASMVVFEGGAPKKSDYRKFGIRGDFDGSRSDPAPRPDAKRRRRRTDDVAAMQEVLSRRPAASSRPTSRRTTRPRRELRRAPRPDRDRRGEGTALRRDQGAGAADGAGVAVISLAKRIEEVFVPGRSEPIVLEKGSDALRVLQRVGMRRIDRDHLPSAAAVTRR